VAERGGVQRGVERFLCGFGCLNSFQSDGGGSDASAVHERSLEAVAQHLIDRRGMLMDTFRELVGVWKYAVQL
jgi:hypothetical protein